MTWYMRDAIHSWLEVVWLRGCKDPGHRDEKEGQGPAMLGSGAVRVEGKQQLLEAPNTLRAIICSEN
jgi:hypothetical protein